MKYWNAEGKRVTRQAHKVMLETFAGQRAPMACSPDIYDDNGQNNRWRPGTEEESRKRGGNLFSGDGGDQHRDKVRNNGGPLPVPPPAHDCINHASAAGRPATGQALPSLRRAGRPGRRRRCSATAENLRRVAEHFGYKGTDCVFAMAQQHGGYRGSKDGALTQGRKWSQRVTQGRARSVCGAGNAASQPGSSPRPRQQGGKAGNSALRAASPPGQG